MIRRFLHRLARPGCDAVCCTCLDHQLAMRALERSGRREEGVRTPGRAFSSGRPGHVPSRARSTNTRSAA